MENEYGITRNSVIVRDPIRMVTLLPPVLEEYVPPTPKELREMRIRMLKKVMRKILLISGIITVGLGVSVGGSLLLQMVPCGEGLSILWGICCGLAMIMPVTAVIDD